MSETITVEIDKDQYNQLRELKGNKKRIIQFLDDAVNNTFEFRFGKFSRGFDGIRPFEVPGRWHESADNYEGIAINREANEALVKFAKNIESRMAVEESNVG